jgi:hypothetical protein
LTLLRHLEVNRAIPRRYLGVIMARGIGCSARLAVLTP